ncbi:DUF1579 domain-containing protein [bacterium]|nr:DUF1579 domain-containing protein [bacterium]
MKKLIGTATLTLALVLGAGTFVHAQESRPTTQPTKMMEKSGEHHRKSAKALKDQDIEKTKQAMDQQMAEMEEMMADYEVPQPAPEHKVLAQSEGTWDAAITMWMAPGAPPLKTTGKETNEMMGPFWLKSEMEMDFMGQTMQGAGIIGFDTQKNELFVVWADSTSSVPTVMDGSVDKATGTMTFEGEMYDPMAGQYVHMRMVEEHPDNDHRVTRMYVKGQDGEEFITMQIEYTRRK